MSLFWPRAPLPLIRTANDSDGTARRRPLPWLMGAIVAFAAFLLTAAAPPLAERSTFLLSFAAVAAAAWIAGWRAAAAAVVVSTIVDAVFLIPPAGSLLPMASGDVLRLSTFVLVAGSLTISAALAENAVRRLHLSQELSRVVVENAPVLVTGADAQGNTVLFNHACEQLTGYERRQVLGKPLLETFVPPAWRSVVAARFRDQSIEQLATPHENPWLTKAAAERLIEWRCFRVQLVDARTVTLGIGQDVTERRSAEDALRAALAAADTANRTKERFIATLSHELRSPLTAALGWMQMLRVAPQGPNAARAAALVERNLHLMAALLEDVMDYARAGVGKLALAPESTDVRLVLQGIIASSKPAADQSDVQVRADVAPDVPLVMADAKRLQQMLLNLVNNAIKFTPTGGEIIVGAAATATGDVEISVRDTGIGIPQEQLEHVFEPFWQSERRPADGTGGLGLGLALVKELAEAQDGNVRIESDGPGTGACVTITLPGVTARQELAG